MGNYGANVEPAFDHDRHFVPGLVHLATVDALDGEHVEYDDVPIDGHFSFRDAEHGDSAAVAHVRKHVAEGGAVARHFEPDVESFLHAEFSLDLGQCG